MRNKLAVLVSVILFLAAFSICLAGELISPQAVEYFNEAVKFQKGKRYDEAQIYYNKTLLVDPYNIKWKVFIINNIGLMHAEAGDLKRAEEQFNMALKLDPNFMPAKLNLGFIYEKNRTELESIKYWIKILKIDLDSLKPKRFVMAEEQSKEKKE